MAAVTIDNVYKSFGQVQVIHGASVDIQDGEFMILVGPSGCGKSTLLRMVAGLETITSGEIRVGAKVINNVPPKDRDIAMVFQSYALYPHMTVAENMSFSLRLAREKKSVISEKVAKAAEILGLRDLLDRRPRQLSGGQRQRVAMGRAIVRDPKVFLFDEPLSNLDAKLRVQMRGEIKELQQRLGTTTIYVTHDQIEAMTMAEKIVVLHDGAIEQIGSPLELYDFPVNRFVAGFIGSPSMNFLQGTIRKGDPNTFELEKGGSFSLDEIADEWDGRPATLGIRPEHLEMTDDSLCADAQVAVLEPTGSETQIVARIGDQELTIIVHRRLHMNPGDPIKLRPRRSAYHLFDADSGERMETN